MNRQILTLFNSTGLCLFVLLFVSGCTLKATTESLTDTTTNILSSTTPGAWFTADGLLKPDEKVNAFVATNYHNLQQNIAQGEGEYLTALGALLDIQEANMDSFHARAQENFQDIFIHVEHHPQSVSTMFSHMQGALETD
ncbi:MAG: hypothetical protein NPIRA05_16840 [Nitrospirales bacterium]|nr:MAG: hypothetical protein NPIRA05_16840 [Nitrospirales bacterium]